MTRIDGLNPLLTGRTLQGQGANGVDGANGDGTARETDGARNRQDNIALSHRGRMVAEAAHAVAQAPEVRAAKVAALKAAIADGTYTSDSREIAARLLATGSLDD